MRILVTNDDGIASEGLKTLITLSLLRRTEPVRHFLIL